MSANLFVGFLSENVAAVANEACVEVARCGAVWPKSDSLRPNRRFEPARPCSKLSNNYQRALPPFEARLGSSFTYGSLPGA
jgi:hypothetical protein